MITRETINPLEIEEALAIIKHHFYQKLKEKGDGAFASTHEIIGLLDEEFNELRDACHDNNIDDFSEELIDVAIVAIFGYASIISGKIR